MIGEPDAGKPHVRFDEGAQETCDIAARLCPTLQSPHHESDLFLLDRSGNKSAGVLYPSA
jgi:hypothetical protein